jgi:hypothetical protein
MVQIHNIIVIATFMSYLHQTKFAMVCKVISKRLYNHDETMYLQKIQLSQLKTQNDLVIYVNFYIFGLTNEQIPNILNILICK